MEDIYQRVAKASGFMKITMGVVNNATWAVCLDAFDHAKQCQGYQHAAKHATKEAIQAWKSYEGRLLSPTGVSLFHLSDFGDEIRERYGRISDRDYYELWTYIGFAAYGETKPLIMSLWNKHRLNMVHRNIQYAAHLAWMKTAISCLEICGEVYRMNLDVVQDEFGVKKSLSERIYGGLETSDILKRMRKALGLLEPATDYELTSLERKNTELGERQLYEAWTDDRLLSKVTLASVKDNAECFASAKIHRRIMMNLAKE